jgi:hypothetical protein
MSLVDFLRRCNLRAQGKRDLFLILVGHLMEEMQDECMWAKVL